MSSRSSLSDWIGECAFLKETTIHPLGCLDKNNPPRINWFWVVISILALSFSVFQINRDLQKMKMNNYEVNVRFIKQQELIKPSFKVCLSHWVLWVDFDKSYHEFNLTKLELLTLLAPFNNKFRADECPSPEGVRDLMTSALSKIGLLSDEPISLEAIYHKLKRPIENPSDENIVLSTAPSIQALRVCHVLEMSWLSSEDYPTNAYILIKLVTSLQFYIARAQFSAAESKRLAATLAMVKLFVIHINNQLFDKYDPTSPTDRMANLKMSYDMQCQIEEKQGIIKDKLAQGKQYAYKDSFSVKIWNTSFQVQVRFFIYLIVESLNLESQF